MKRKGFIEVVSVFLVVLFIYSAIRLAVEHNLFRNGIIFGLFSIKNFSWLFVDRITWLITGGLSCVEIGIAVMLLVPKWKLKGLYLSFFLLILLSIYLLVIYNYSTAIPFIYGGIIPGMSLPVHVIMNFAFLVLTLIGILVYPVRKSTLA